MWEKHLPLLFNCVKHTQNHFPINFYLALNKGAMERSVKKNLLVSDSTAFYSFKHFPAYKHKKEN